ncbi:MAG: nucleoside triphosphate pyrophosphohydrolase [Oscillospiraceae bacterium]
MKNGFVFKENYNIEDLLLIMEKLRAPDGCMWDREQTHESIRGSLLEEAYEAADAIDHNNSDEMNEELGDVLLQVVFHAQIAKERGEFDFNTVSDGICKKLILRHPHVFGNVCAKSSEEILDNWEAIKQKEKNLTTPLQNLQSVPKAFPSLMRAAKVQKRAQKAGYSFSGESDICGMLHKQIDEISAEKAETMIGEILFSVVSLARYLQIDAEEALSCETERFIKGFSVNTDNKC